MRSLRLDELVARLPSALEQPGLLVPQGEALTTSPTPVEGYVPATFEQVEWPAGATVLLVEAAGAVGKSAAAQALAARLNWPLVRAEKAQVGDYSLSGLIQDALGFEGTYIQQVAQGAAGVVVDSMDEAHFRAGTQNFLAFLRNVQSVSGGRAAANDSRQPSLVLLSRADTAELIRLAFADAAIPLATLRLQFFDAFGAAKFINSYMAQRYSETKRPEYNVPLASPGPFETLRNERFRQVMRVLLGRTSVSVEADWHHCKDFLGYAPVLVAIAESLAVSNPAAERSSLRQARATSESDLLHDIVKRILDREHRKFRENLFHKLLSNLPASSSDSIDPESMYAPSEQVLRVASLVHGNPLVSPPPAALPMVVRDIYEQSAVQFVADHPFVKGRNFASNVFADYVNAMACMTLDGRAALERQIVPRGRDVGPFFILFLRRFALESVDYRLTEQLIEPLLNSWIQETELRGAPTSRAIVQLSPVLSTLHFLDFNEEKQEAEHVVFTIEDASGAFHLQSGIRNVMILTDQGVILGTRSEHMTLGSDTTIIAAEIAIEAESLGVARGANREGAVLAAERVEANYLTHVDATPQTLTIYTDNPPPRLHGFRSTLTSGATKVEYGDYIALRAILTFFRSNVHLGLAASHDRLDQTIIRDNPLRVRIVEALHERGVMHSEGEWYVLDPKALSELGFGLGDLKTGTPSESVMLFLADCRRATDDA